MDRRIVTLLALLVALPLVVATGPPASAETPPGGHFVDDDGNVHESAIEAIRTAGITRGCNPPANDRFCPDQPVTRQEMAAFLVRAFELTGSGDHDFEDVAASNIFGGDIARLAAAGITRGCNPPVNDRFCPDQPVTRQQMAAFLVRSLGLTALHDEPFDDVAADSVFAADISRLAAAGITRGCNPPANDRFCPRQSVTRAEMASFLARALGLATDPVPPRTGITAREVGDGYGTVTWIGGFPDDDRTFVADTRGRIRVLGARPGATVLDIGSLVTSGGERGLLGVAVHPSGDGRVVIHYTDTSGDSRIVEYRWDGSRIDPASARLLLRVDQPRANHNGGGLAFDDDGLLYISLGDGGGGGDPDGHGQNTDTLLGTVLRVIPSGDAYPSNPDRNYRIPDDNPFTDGGGDPAIWLWGVRNAWRIHLHDGDLYVADVGQGSREEVTVLPVDGPGANLGWASMEGSICHRGSCADMVGPTIDYGHGDGSCSITGGVVLPDAPVDLADTYLYSDYCGGWLRSFVLRDGAAADQRTWDVGDLGRVTTFGIGPGGRVYVAGSGEIRELVVGAG